MQSKYAVKLKENGCQVKVPRIVYLEPDLFDLLERKGKLAGRTRSEQIGHDLKQVHRGARGLATIDWTE
jgi:hypothetical protein